MFDTMTLTKATGAICGSLLVFLLGGWAAESIYSMGGGHGEDHAQGYVIDTGDEGASEEPVDEGPDLAALFAEADAGKGERVFNKCKACHQVEDGANGVGPHLYDVVSRDVGSVDGFGYSGALSEAADVWTAENLFAFLENPAGYAPGTSMGFAGLGKPEDRANVMEFMASYGGAPAKPEPVAPEAEDAGEDAPGAGQGPVEGAEAGAAESATGMSADQPVPAANAATNTDAATKVDE